MKKIAKSEKEWKTELNSEAFSVLRNKQTEPPFTGRLLKNKDSGVYRCAGCKTPLFSSESKFDSGTGWPSFTQPVSHDHVEEEQDTSHGMKRTEVHCAVCGGHLGHVFNDGPQPTGKRFCINSAALQFQKQAKK